jgi:hypothetical protein
VSDELTDLRARLEALAAKWDVEASDVARTHGAGAYDTCATELRALLAPVAAPEPPKCEECVSCYFDCAKEACCAHGLVSYFCCDKARSDDNSCGPMGRFFGRRGTN